MIKTGAAAGAGLALPTYLSAAAHSGFTNAPTGDTVTLGFNVPQSGPYADEGADELRAFELAVEHLNGQGDGGMLNTFSSKALEGNGIMGKKVQFVTGDTQTKSDAARASAQSMIQKDGAIMISGGSSSGVAVAVQGLCQEAGVIFMSGLTHSNDTTGKDKKANGFRHFFNAYMSAAALAPVLKNLYGDDRRNLPSCFSCHGPSGFGVAPSTPSIAAQQPGYTAGRLAALARFARSRPGAVMPAIAARLNDTDRRAVADYLATLPPSPVTARKDAR